MKKLIVSLVASLLVALLGIIGLNIFKNAGPRERVKAENGSKIIVEELSFYKGSDKIFGKVYKPADEKGNFPDSLGARPVVVFFHDPMKSSYPESFIKSLVPQGLVGFTAAIHGKEKEVEFLVKKIGKEKFADADRIYLVSDTACSEVVVKAAVKLKGAAAGLVLIEPELSGKTASSLDRLKYESLTIDASKKASAKTETLDYLELMGALK